jgi:hypothetical protein
LHLTVLNYIVYDFDEQHDTSSIPHNVSSFKINEQPSEVLKADNLVNIRSVLILCTFLGRQCALRIATDTNICRDGLVSSNKNS